MIVSRVPRALPWADESKPFGLTSGLDHKLIRMDLKPFELDFGHLGLIPLAVETRNSVSSVI
jgi:hypothetical protein